MCTLFAQLNPGTIWEPKLYCCSSLGLSAGVYGICPNLPLFPHFLLQYLLPDTHPCPHTQSLSKQILSPKYPWDPSAFLKAVITSGLECFLSSPPISTSVLPGGSVVKNPPVNAGDAYQFLDWEDTVWQPTPVFLPGESHGQSSLTGCSPCGHKESDTT